MVLFQIVKGAIYLQALVASTWLTPVRSQTSDDTIIDSPRPWLSLPATPTLPAMTRGSYANVNNIHLWYNTFGNPLSKDSPVVFLHGGLGNSDYFGHQVRALKWKYRIITVDTRGHGRSTRDEEPFGYDLFSEDFVALLDHLKIPKASFVGWSDGAICALNIAAKHPERVDRVFAFAANYNTSGVMDITKSPVFTTYINRTVSEYDRMSPQPDEYDTFLRQIQDMWNTQPNWDQSFFAKINSSKVWIVDGDHEEAVYRSQQDDMARWLPDAGQLLLPQVSHFAFLQDHVTFTTMVRRLLESPF